MRQQIRFVDRLKMAWRLLIDGSFAAKVESALEEFERFDAKQAKTGPPAERVHASGLLLLAALQREGRLVDFLRQDVTAFSDEDVGAAARVVHGGSRKVLQQFFEFEPAMKGDEGAPVAVQEGFDSQRVRLTGNVTGRPPFKGTLKHHGWIATAVRMPEISEVLDPRVVAPAEVELP
jgi:hypothetical protein